MKDCTGLADASSLKLRPSCAAIKIVTLQQDAHADPPRACLCGRKITPQYVSLYYVTWQRFCKDAPKMQNPITGRIPGAVGTRQECVSERVKLGRVLAFYMLVSRAPRAADADLSVTRTALSDSTPLT